MNDAFAGSIGLLPLIIAQVPGADRSEIITVLLGGAALAVIANQVFTLWRNATGRFQERSGGPRAVTQEECREQHHQSANVMDRIDRAHAERTEHLRLEIKADVNGIYNRISEETRGMRAELNLVSTGFGELRGMMKKMLNGSSHAD